VTVVPQPVSGSYTYAVPVPSMDYDIYSIRIYDNSGNQNDATVGEGLATTDDFDYAPFPPHGIKL
ncbi:MAG: hypothetical protein U9R19_14715, partial [Bacteroidota bacterium]|nr:hypothetical protein [Bacteroidota bacterium]